MPTLFNQQHFQSMSSERMTGCMDQVAGIRLFEYSDGKMRSMRAADVWTGSGFRFTVFLDRGMDIGPAEFGGMPLRLDFTPAQATPSFYEPVGGGFVHTFGGGLVVTCGLTHFGPPSRKRMSSFRSMAGSLIFQPNRSLSAVLGGRCLPPARSKGRCIRRSFSVRICSYPAASPLTWAPPRFKSQTG